MPNDLSDTCFLLWRRGEVIVATVADVPYGEPERMSFEGLDCAPLEIGMFFDHLVSPDRRPQTPGKQLVGLALYPELEGDDSRRAMQDFLCAKNVSGDPGWLKVQLCRGREFEDDCAQGFSMQGFVNPNGRLVIAIPACWSQGLAIGFESVSAGAPTVN